MSYREDLPVGKSLFRSNKQLADIEYAKQGWKEEDPNAPYMLTPKIKSTPYTCFVCLLTPLNFIQLRRHMLVLHNKAYINRKFVDKSLVSTQNQQVHP